MNANTGATLWTYAVADEFCVTTPAVANGMVYFGCYREDDYDGNNGIYAFDAAAGVLRWHVGTGSTSPLTVANGILYFGESFGGAYAQLTALNATSGALLWKYGAGFGSEYASGSQRHRNVLRLQR